jgi:hypothetical protein
MNIFKRVAHFFKHANKHAQKAHKSVTKHVKKHTLKYTLGAAVFGIALSAFGFLINGGIMAQQ